MDGRTGSGREVLVPEDTAGGLMNTDTVTVRPDITIDVVLRYLRRHRTLPPMTDSLIVVSRRDNYRYSSHYPHAGIQSRCHRAGSWNRYRADPRHPVRHQGCHPVRALRLISAPVVDETNGCWAGSPSMTWSTLFWMSRPLPDEHGRPGRRRRHICSGDETTKRRASGRA